MEIYYLINNRKFLDNYLIRKSLDISKSDLQQLMKSYKFPENEIIILQNKKLYSKDILNDFIENLIENNGK